MRRIALATAICSLCLTLHGTVRLWAGEVPPELVAARDALQRNLVLGEWLSGKPASSEEAAKAEGVADGEQATQGEKATRGAVSTRAVRAGGAPSFRTVLGPLLRVNDWKTDLCPFELRQKARARGFRRQLIATGILAALLTLLSAGLFVARVADVRRQLSGIDDALVALEPTAQRVQSMDQVLRDLAVVRQGTDLLDALAELSSIIPASMKVSTLTYQRGRLIDVTGIAGGLDEVLEAARALENSPLFAQATVRYANTRRGREADVTDFRMVLMVAGNENSGF